MGLNHQLEKKGFGISAFLEAELHRALKGRRDDLTLLRWVFS